MKTNRVELVYWLERELYKHEKGFWAHFKSAIAEQMLQIW